nr:BadF/BadG/BcrA/BcrD ATPase family protein [Kineococcus siccus]
MRGTEFVIAVDSGGTSTRVGCFGLDGTLLSRAAGRGGAAHHDDQAAVNLREAISTALAAGDLAPDGACGLAVGVAGIGRAGSNQGGGTAEWADAFYPLPFLRCPRVFVNDAVIAHRGALLGHPGVVVVAGTGSMILAIDEHGAEVESGQFEHYAGGARHLVFDVVHDVLRGRATRADGELLERILRHWGAADLAGLRSALLAHASLDRNVVKRRYGDLAPTVTALADSSPSADRALRALTDRTACGVHLLAPFAGAAPVSVGLTGSLACDPAFSARLGDSLDLPGTTPARVVTSALSPLGGAALLAYEESGITAGPDVVERLRTAT